MNKLEFASDNRPGRMGAAPGPSAWLVVAALFISLVCVVVAASFIISFIGLLTALP